jgi:hypothetical protein
MSFQVLDAISPRRRPILGFREDDGARGPRPGIVLIDVVNMDEYTINDPWQGGP